MFPSYESELAWMAGFVDGEGCISVQRIKRSWGCHYDPSFTVGQEAPKPLEILLFHFGGKIIYKKNQRKGKGLYWVWYCPQPMVKKALKMLLPYLVVKKGEAENAINFCEFREQRWESKKSKHFKYTQPEKDKLENFHLNSVFLNKHTSMRTNLIH